MKDTLTAPKICAQEGWDGGDGPPRDPATVAEGADEPRWDLSRAACILLRIGRRLLDAEKAE